MKSNKILVIGGSGFVGSFLIDTLDKSSTTNFDKTQSPFFSKITTIGNVLEKKALNKVLRGIDVVVLLAAEHRDDVLPVSMYYDVNVEGTKNVLEAMDNNNVKKVIFTSSVAIYGLNKDNPNETSRANPFNHYGKSKWEAEQVLRNWFNKNPNEKSVTILRPTVIFGERNRGNVYNLLKFIASGKFVMIGKGTNEKSMAYVRNVVAFIKELIEYKEFGYQVYNYVDKPDFSTNQLVSLVNTKLGNRKKNLRIPYFIGILAGHFFDLVAFLTKKKLDISAVRIKKFCATTQFDASKAKAVFHAPYSLEEGLNKTIVHEFVNPQKDDVLFFSE